MPSKRQRVSQSKSWSGSAVSAALASITLAAAVAGFLSSSNTSQQRRADEARQQQMVLNERSRELEEATQNQRAMQQRLNELLEKLTKKGGAPASGRTVMLSDQDRALIDQVVEQQRQISGRLSALEGALMNDPVKALSVPLLKKDVDTIQEREKTDAAEVRSEVDRLYTFSEWFMGLIIATAVSILALAIPRLRTGKKGSDESRSTDEPQIPAAPSAAS